MSYRYHYNEALEQWLSLKTGQDRITWAVVDKIKEVFPQINPKSKVQQAKVIGKKRPGLCKVGRSIEYIPVPTDAPRPGFIAKLWRFWWVLWSHDEPMEGVLWQRGWQTSLPDKRIERDKWVKFERFGWIDNTFFALQREPRQPESVIVGYDPDEDLIYI